MRMQRYLAAFDQGTTGSTVLLCALDGRILAKVNVEIPAYYPQPGWVEHEPESWWSSSLEALKQAQAEANVQPEGCCAVGVTNQRETTALWSRADGKPLGRAIVWQDRRTAPQCEALRSRGFEALLRERAGLVVDPYFSGTKLAWLLRENGLHARAAAGEIAFGTVDAFMVHKLTAGARHVTDPSNASRTMLYNIHTRSWDSDLAAALDVPMALLPDVVPSSGSMGVTKGVPGLPDGTPITGMAGDQNAALFGQGCFDPGAAKCTYGTGAFLLKNVGPQPKPSEHRLLSTIAWQVGDEVTYALEGSAFVAGAAVQWLRDALGIISESAEVEALAREVESSDGVVFVPALAGLGSPHWQPDARGIIAGLTRGSTKAHIARATLEGIAWQIVDLCSAIEADAGVPLATLRVDGGASENNLLLQIQADCLGKVVERPRNIETTALGAVYLAGLGAGVWSHVDELRALNPVDTTFEPTGDAAPRRAALERWHEAVSRTAPL